MPTIKFVKNIPPLEVAVGAGLMASLLAGGRPVASSCHGDGVCAKCKVRVIEGAANLSPVNATEQMLRDRLCLGPDLRIACQAEVRGDVTVDTSYW